MKKFLALSLFSALLTGQAFACSCSEGWPSADDVLKGKGSVFLGIPAKSVQLTRGEEPLIKTKFTIVRGFKDAPGKFVDVYSIKSDGANCGVHFQGNDAVYLVFTSKHQGKLHTSSCDLGSIYEEDTELTALIRDLSAQTK